MLHELQALPDGFVDTRDALHQIAFFAVAPKRYREVGRLGLRAVGQGFGTPEFGDGERVLVEGTDLIWRLVDTDARQPISTVRDAAAFLGIPYEEVWFADFHDPPTAIPPDDRLQVSREASLALGDWFRFASDVLEEARRTPGTVEVSEVQLWPEHFDPAFEMGSQQAGRRASYGGSPGDANHPEPYLYVSAWGEIDRSRRYWNDPHFDGASLGYAELLAADDPFATGVEFLRQGYQVLGGE